MALLIALLVSGLLLAGFLALTAVEAKSGRRMFAPMRAKLDAEVAHAAGVLRRADLGALFFHGLRALLEYLVREGVHAVLALVRAAERLLTGVARELRSREEMLMSSRTFLSAWLTRAKRRFGKKDSVE